MPFQIQHSGRLGDVLPAAEKSSDAQHTALGKNKVAEAGKSLVQKLLQALKEVLSDFSPESDAALILTGDAGENHLSIQNMQLSVAKPREGVTPPDNTTASPIPSTEGGTTGNPAAGTTESSDKNDTVQSTPPQTGTPLAVSEVAPANQTKPGGASF